MTDFQTIYATGAERYDALVSREDYEGHLLPALQAIRPLSGLHVIEMGAGTGRITRLLAPSVATIRAYDASAHMLAAAHRTLAAHSAANWTLAVGDNRALPTPSACADLCLAGWSLGHFCGWYPDTWHVEIGLALDEMRRVLRPGGAAIIIETLGTGHTTPTPPTESLAAYYHWLETEHGFTRTWIRTDYRFASLDEAVALTGFFFGPDLADRVQHGSLLTLPECTGLWSKEF